ncbi:MAG: hypothetical protein BAA01_09525 [Bacillus thermozeamaize]|uniref:Uncharacterized protein n=1 Tax=Bacillus thermozeamaize TaxID=230954 RepID=A0A1Y3PKR9_9BACI|nr:MAG: hypothetical protein BAA01_09525 [Bacillus thermozeamaize]
MQTRGACFTALKRNQIALIVEPHALHGRLAAMMLLVVAILTKQLKVFPVQTHIGIIYVLRIQIHLVMHNLSRATTTLTKPMSRNKKSVTALPPRP